MLVQGTAAAQSCRTANGVGVTVEQCAWVADMMKQLRSFVDPEDPDLAGGCSRIDGRVPSTVWVDVLPAFSIDAHLALRNGIPLLDWEAARAWVERAGPGHVRAAAWNACTRAWLLHLRDALGERYSLDESGVACILSSFDLNSASAALACMNRTVVRTGRVLPGVARLQAPGREILIVFDDGGRYRDYVLFQGGIAGAEFAFERAMHLNAGYSHYAMVRGDPLSLEPLIVRNMVRGCIAHLPLPCWLDEGLAATVQRRLAGPAQAVPVPEDLRERHREFWSEVRIQEFWSGASFACGGEAGLLSRDLACLMAERMAADWPRFLRFAQQASKRDGAAAAAQQHLGLCLGATACSLLGRPPSGGWAPDPCSWQTGAA